MFWIQVLDHIHDLHILPSSSHLPFHSLNSVFQRMKVLILLRFNLSVKEKLNVSVFMVGFKSLSQVHEDILLYVFI